MTCVDAVRKVFEGDPGVLTTRQVIEKIYTRHPEKPWRENTISAHLIGLSVNHPSCIHYPWARKQAFLFSLGNGRYRLWDPDKDGKWKVTDGGVKLADESEEDCVDDSEDIVGSALSFERDLENSLVSNIEQLEQGLVIYNKDDLYGCQLDTGVVGRLDILAVDEEGRLVVIELKAGEVGDKVCGQLLRYMGWVKRKLAGEGQEVRGIIVASGFKDRLKYAVDAMPNVLLKRYAVNFSFVDEQ